MCISLCSTTIAGRSLALGVGRKWSVGVGDVHRLCIRTQSHPALSCKQDQHDAPAGSIKKHALMTETERLGTVNNVVRGCQAGEGQHGICGHGVHAGVSFTALYQLARVHQPC